VNDRFAQSSFNTKFITGFLALAMIGVSIYLTQHFYQVHFPQGIGAGSLCDISSFFNCDGATNSPLSNIFGAPISLLGLLTGGIFLLGVTTTILADSTIIAFGAINFVGCLILFLYSLVALGSLCPFCTVYYILSGATFFIFYRNSNHRSLHIPSFTAVSLIFILTIATGHFVYAGKVKDQASIKESLVKQFNALAKSEDPKYKTDFYLARTGESLKDAPAQMIIFSDFQCPACKALSKMVHPLVKRYKENINIDYYFYPLDPACNAKMTRNLHPLACKASYFTYCTREKFLETHDLIFDNQSDLSDEWIESKVREYGVSDCYNDPETRKEVMKIVDQGNDFLVKSTPTFFLNNVKIEGALPLNQLYMLIDEVLAQSKEK
jgi:protein-disulfide isomerase/uncharacterized membrane protein